MIEKLKALAKEENKRGVNKPTEEEEENMKDFLKDMEYYKEHMETMEYVEAEEFHNMQKTYEDARLGEEMNELSRLEEEQDKIK